MYLFSDDSGIRRSDVVNWYLKTIEKDIETEEELAEKKTILDKVLDRLISFVSWNFFCKQYFCDLDKVVYIVVVNAVVCVNFIFHLQQGPLWGFERRVVRKEVTRRNFSFKLLKVLQFILLVTKVKLC